MVFFDISIFHLREKMKNKNILSLSLFVSISFLFIWSLTGWAEKTVASAKTVSPKQEIPIDSEAEDECLTTNIKGSKEFMPGCFGFSESRSAAFCVIGKSLRDAGQPVVSVDDQLSLVSIPKGLVAQQCTRSEEGREIKSSFIVAGQRLAAVQKALDTNQVNSLPKTFYTLKPRTTLDLTYPAFEKKIRLRWNQKFLEEREVGCGTVYKYRDRISLMCSPNKKGQSSILGQEGVAPTLEEFSNTKAPSLPKTPKFIEDTVYLNENEGEAETKIYSLAKGRYLLVEITKTRGEPGLSESFYDAALIDTQRCQVVRADAE